MTPHDEAVCAFYCMTARHGGWLELDLRSEAERVTAYHECVTIRDAARLAETVRLAHDRNFEVAVSLPRPQRGWGTVGSASLLWCRVEGTEQVQRAARFRPLPTMVVREGQSSRRLLMWALDDRLPYERVLDFNRRIAYHLRAVQKHADPDRLMVSMPGTVLHVGRSRPVAVTASRLALGERDCPVFGAEQVAGRLKAPPDVKWYEREKAA